VKRLLAVIGAIVMIVAAIVIRSALEGTQETRQSGKRTTIACIAELESACRSLTNVDVRIEDAVVTAKTLANGTANIDGWVTFEPWPDMVNLLADRQIAGVGTRLARTDLVIAMAQDREQALAPTCGGSVNWKCLGDAIGNNWSTVGGDATWGAVKAGIPPLTTAQGVLLLGEAASGYFNTASFATNDFDDAFLVWKSRVTANAATFTQFIQQFPAKFAAVGTTRVEALESGSKPVATIDPSPAAMAIVTVAPVNGARLPDVAGQLKNRLRDGGWSTQDFGGLTGLPGAGVLLALSGLTG